MFSLVELIADKSSQAPCKFGNIVEDHACYCHADHWEEGPRKCPVWSQFGVSDSRKWHRRQWPLHELPMFHGYKEDGSVLVKNEMRQYLPDDEIGGCPYFEPIA